MNLPWYKPQPPYSQLDFDNQTAHIEKLNKLRDAAMQKAILYGKDSDYKQQKYLEEVDRYYSAIEAAQEVLNFMQDEVLQYTKRMQAKRKGK